MTKEEIISTLLKMGIRTEDELEFTGCLGLELEPNGNKILYLCDTRLGSLDKDDEGNYKIDIDQWFTTKSSNVTNNLKDLTSITTCENIESLEYLYNKTKMYLNNIETFIKYYKGIE